MFKRKLDIKVNYQCVDPNGRYVILVVTFNKEKCVLAYIYGPNHDHPAFFHKVMQEIDNCNVDLKITGGDFNFVLNTQLDRQGGQCNTYKESLSFLKAYMNTRDLTDVWRELNPDKFLFTWKDITPSQFSPG